MIAENKKQLVAICIYTLLAMAIVTAVAAEDNQQYSRRREYRIKAEFLYNFFKAVEWPKESIPEQSEPIAIGIVGRDPFGDILKPLKKKTVKGRKIVVRYFDDPNQPEDSNELTVDIHEIKKCQMVYVCSSQQKQMKELIGQIKGLPVLTVGEIKGFADAGGVINFVSNKEKPIFEINMLAAKDSNLKVSSKLLRIASRVINAKGNWGKGGTDK